MKLKIGKNGHQYYCSWEGEVIQWTTKAERFGQVYIQVPAVLLRCRDRIELIPLDQYLYWFEIDIIEGQDEAEKGRDI